MKKKLLVLIISILLSFGFIIPSNVSAHLAGQPPFFKINGTYSGYYPVYSTSLSSLTLPQDLAPDKYLVNQPIEFEIDTKQLQKVVPEEVIGKTKFIWDFGDGEKREGVKNTHIYTKMGSYILTIHADTSAIEKDIPPQLLQSVLLNVLPHKDYKLPQSVIMVNGKTSKDPITDVLSFEFKEKLHFDAYRSTAPSSSIVSYFWDFGDGQSDIQKVIEHSYTKDLQIVFPLLRIKDQNGFISDSFVEISNALLQTQNNPLKAAQTKPSQMNNEDKRPSQLPYVALGVAILVFFIISTRWLRKLKGKK